VVLLTAATVLVIVAVVAFTFAFTSGSGQGSGTPTSPDSAAVLAVEQALLAEAGQDIKVGGHFVSTGGKAVLASALAESMPPLAGGATIQLPGLDLADIVGRSTTSGRAGTADVTWSGFPIVLRASW
jgi:hypothetical protein